jgi:SAM-dependent methyltransferase
VLSLLKDYLKNKSNLRILDIGCGPGNFLSRFSKYGKCFGLDFTYEALYYTKLRGYSGVNADVCFSPFKDHSIDVVLMLDVIEHISDEDAALKEVRRVLKPEGRFILTAPAYNALWGSHDTMYGHLRRYRANKLVNKLKEAGFKVIKNSYIEPLFLLPLLIMRRIKGLRGSDDFLKLPDILNKFLTYSVSLEGLILKRFSFPFGVSIVCLAQAKKDINL